MCISQLVSSKRQPLPAPDQSYKTSTFSVSAIYRDDSGGIGYYSGLIAEPPSERNNQRYLLFFDDGYTQYSPPNEIYRICHQSKENWKEANESSQEFIKRYLAQYPQRPMVRLKPGQTIDTELDGDWVQATVEKVDASLALMKFSRTHFEWIYRGSTRLEPLFSDFVRCLLSSICVIYLVLKIITCKPIVS
ncbi:Histone-lysine N-methyltransferase SETDB1-B [Schistosoma japonicum]|uniref:Histone-lysine N-methyltransferase SETDB1-B n=1 Tax=Schistosoma japonicum TaxID=6182 RepID=A0A4Z2CVV5_SCHJA|nr:Histone-lysine N-methyltransferase eggless [Schistosoma japonicum]TNN08274.1 Histone-lysine N-methyltransferase SETDB1-B [Schistosoma japonicum]